MSTAAQTKRYDRGYEDAIEGFGLRAGDHYYLKGYYAGQVFNRENDEQAEREDAAAQLIHDRWLDEAVS